MSYFKYEKAPRLKSLTLSNFVTRMRTSFPTKNRAWLVYALQDYQKTPQNKQNKTNLSFPFNV